MAVSFGTDNQSCAFGINVCPIKYLRGGRGKDPVPRHGVFPLTGPPIKFLGIHFCGERIKVTFFTFFPKNTNAKWQFSSYIGYEQLFSQEVKMNKYLLNDQTMNQPNTGLPGFSSILSLIKDAKDRIVKTVNTEIIDLYWQIGKEVSGG